MRARAKKIAFNKIRTEPFFGVTELADILGVSDVTIYQTAQNEKDMPLTEYRGKKGIWYRDVKKWYDKVPRNEKAPANTKTKKGKNPNRRNKQRTASRK